MNQQQAIEMALGFLRETPFLIFGTINAQGFPNVRGMENFFADKLENIYNIYLCTHTKSNKSTEILNNPQTSLYMIDHANYKGITLLGQSELLTDQASKDALWHDGLKVFFLKGADDPRFAVIRFKPQKLSIYANMTLHSFDL